MPPRDNAIGLRRRSTSPDLLPLKSPQTPASTMNIFDAIVLGFTLVAIAFGFHAGLLRSLATILGYVIAAPFAVAVTPPLAFYFNGSAELSNGRGALVLFGVFLVSGMLFSALLRRAVSELAGGEIGLFDRLLGAVLGAVRIALLAVLMVLIFDRIIPPNREPAWLSQSRVRPYLSAAGRRGLRALPPEVTEYIDRLKKQRGL
jgi:membrane protein required for colicin V production